MGKEGRSIMNLANKLTMLRIVLVPFFAFFMLAHDFVPLSFLWAGIMFAAASITDTADGKIARKYNMVTDFGKFLDPLADKILVSTALVCFVQLGWCPAWAAALIIAREFVVSGIRLVAAGSDKKLVIAASVWGKLKTAATMAALSVILIMYICADFGALAADSPTVIIVRDALIYISCLLTVISGAKYLWDYRELLKS